MTNVEMARGHLRRAEVILREAEGLFGEQAWNLIVRRSQEVVELALKGALRYPGLEVPRVHDLASCLRVGNCVIRKFGNLIRCCGIPFEVT